MSYHDDAVLRTLKVIADNINNLNQDLYNIINGIDETLNTTNALIGEVVNKLGYIDRSIEQI